MIHAGTDLKYKVTVDMAGFDIDEDDMELVIKNRWGQTLYSYKAEDFYTNGDGVWFFVVPNVPSGELWATLSCYRSDEDFTENFQKVVDVQRIVSVDKCECDCNTCDCDCGCHETDGMKVVYERVWTVNFIDGQYLADCYGNPIRDCNGELIRFSDRVPEAKDVRINMTAAEFKHWMDDKDENGTIDTRKEIEEVLGGIGDDTEMSIMTEDDTDDMMARILGNN